ncbi:MAG: hypothetical protein GY853_06625 [PVC group bacterium]|nr:hypothetical protein [PVC group bacterium]
MNETIEKFIASLDNYDQTHVLLNRDGKVHTVIEEIIIVLKELYKEIENLKDNR